MALGQFGEDQAVRYLLFHNYLIKARNVVFPDGELDIVALDQTNQELVFCEVKTRSQSYFGHPSAAVNWKKKRSLMKAASHYLQINPFPGYFRFDVITVSPQKISHFLNIFSD